MGDNESLNCSNWDFCQFEAIPKLKDGQNFKSWKTDFLDTLEAQSKAFIRLLNGELKPPGPFTPHPTTHDAIIRKAIYMMMPADETEDFEANRKKYKPTGRDYDEAEKSIKNDNKRAEKEHEMMTDSYYSMPMKIIVSLKVTLTANPRALIADCHDPAEALRILTENYGSPSLQVFVQRWRKWEGYKFKGGNAANFVRRFSQLRLEVEEGYDRLAPIVVFGRFMVAVGSNPRTSPFCNTFQPTENTITEASINEMYRSFIHADWITQQNL